MSTPNVIRPKRPLRLHSRRTTLLALLGLAICLVWVVGPMIMAPILRSHLEGMVAEQLNARLYMGHLSYRFPYSITIDDAHLVAKTSDGHDIELCKARRVDLSLARLPWGEGPLVFEKLIFTDPVLHLVRTADGLVGQNGLIKDDASAQAAAAHPEERLSDIFRLRRFKISGGQVVYEDRTNPDSVPMIWKNLEIDLNTNPTAGVLYEYNLIAQDLPLVDAAASGTMDIDQLMLDVKNFGMKLQVTPDSQQSQLPGKIQELLREHQIDGELTLTGSARVPLRNPSKTRYDAIVDLSKASAWVPQWDASLDHMVLKVRCSSEGDSVSDAPAADDPATDGPITHDAAHPAARSPKQGSAPATRPAAAPSSQPALPAALPPMKMRIELLEAGSGDTILRIENGTALVDPVEGKWHVRQLSGRLHIGTNRAALPTDLQALLQRLNVQGKFEFTARASGPVRPTPGRRAIDDIDYELITYARDMTVQPPTFPMPLKGIGGLVHVQNKLIKLENVQATYGADRIFLASCRLPLQNVPDEIDLQGIDGNIAFGAASDPGAAATPHSAPAPCSATHYPPPIDPLLSALRPSGVFYFSGDCALRRKTGLAGSAAKQTAAADAPPDNTSPADTTPGDLSDYDLGYRFNFGADDLRFLVGPLALPVTHAKFVGYLENAEMSPGAAAGNPDPTAGTGQIRGFVAKLCGGTLSINAQIHTGRVFTYNAKMEINHLDLQQLADACNAPAQQRLETTGEDSGQRPDPVAAPSSVSSSTRPSQPDAAPVSAQNAPQNAPQSAPPLRLSGMLYANLLISGNGPRQDRTLLDNLRAKGEFEVLEGDFWQAPVIGDIIAGIKVARDALTVGQAAASFEVYDQKIVLTNAAISAPVLGLQGAGEIHFDGQAVARVVVAPLGDWRDKLQQSRLPIIGNIAGAVQKMLNSASGALLYEFRVTGTLAHPQISTIPAPILTDSAAAIFGSMLNPGKDDHLIKVLRRDNPPHPATLPSRK